MNRAVLQRLTIVIATCALVACATRRTSLLSVSYVDTSNLAQPAPERWSLHDSVFALFGIPSLRGSVLPERGQEVRMSIGGGMVNQPTHVLRFLRVNGRAMGQLFTYWMTPKAGSEEEAFLDHMARVGRSKCELVRGRVFSACRLTPHSNPDWEALGRALDSIGAWNASNTWAVARRRHTVVALSDTGPWIATMEGTASDQPIYSFEYRTGRSYAMTTYDGQSAAPANFKVLYAAVMKAYR